MTDEAKDEAPRTTSAACPKCGLASTIEVIYKDGACRNTAMCAMRQRRRAKQLATATKKAAP